MIKYLDVSLLCALVLINGCTPKSFNDSLLSPEQESEQNRRISGTTSLMLNPSEVTITTANSTTLSATGGSGEYSFEVLGDATGSIDATTGVYTPPLSSAVATIRVTDSSSSTSDAVVTVNPELQISPTTLTLAVNKTYTFAASGGTGSNVFSKFGGQGTIDASTGIFSSGSTTGLSTLRVTDSYGNTSDSIVTVNTALTVSPSSVSITTTNLVTFSSSGGSNAYTYSVLGSDKGSIETSTGIYTPPSSTGNATVRVTDTSGDVADSIVTLYSELKISSAYYSGGIGDRMTITASGGVTPNTWTIVTPSDAGSWFSSNTNTSIVYANNSRPEFTNLRITDSIGNTSTTLILTTSRNWISGYQPCEIRPGTGQVKCWSSETNLGNHMYGDAVIRGDQSGEMGTFLPDVNLGTGRTALTMATAPTQNFIHKCFILDTGDVKCWGANASGVLGYGDSIRRGDSANEMGDFSPVINLGSGRKAIDIAASTQSACALLDNHRVVCWGEATNGALGNGNSSGVVGDSLGEMGDNLNMVDVGTNRKVNTIVAGDSRFYCVLLDNFKVKCWGSGTNGATGYGDTIDRGDNTGEMSDFLPTIDLGTNRIATSIGASYESACAILDTGQLKCWGVNTTGKLGYGDSTHRGDNAGEMGDTLPSVNLGTDRTALKLGLGKQSNCVILDNYKVKCFGGNPHGILGYGDSIARGRAAVEMGNSLPYVELGTNRTARYIESAFNETCALLDDGTTKCWGDGTAGNGGYGDTEHRGDNANEMGDFLPAVQLW